MIKDNLENIFNDLPSGVKLVIASKKRSISEIEEVICAGAKHIGENYVKEARPKFEAIGNKVSWHLIGHLQKNKARVAVEIFDIIETLDSLELADILDKECKKMNKIMPVLIEVNSAVESQKNGVLPKNVILFLNGILKFENLKPKGLMTMGPFLERTEEIRPYFRNTKKIFDEIKNSYGEKLEWTCLSMGMSETYKIAIEEGANIIRVGTAIFGEREY